MKWNLLFAGLLVLAACQRAEAPVHAGDSADKQAEHADAPQPIRPVIAAWPADTLLESPNLPANTREMFSRLAPRDRELVEGFYANYTDHVVSFTRPEELRWMIRNGYPMPEDVLAAAKMSDQELEARFRAGDDKAGYFLLDRKAAGVEDGVGSIEDAMFAQEIVRGGSPFSGYALYRYHMRLRGGWPDAMAGLMWADYRGDDRAGDLLMKLLGNPAAYDYRTISPASTFFAYQALLNRINGLDPSLLTSNRDPLILHADQGPASP